MRKNSTESFLSEMLLIIGVIFIGSSLKIIAKNLWITFLFGVVFVFGAVLIKYGIFDG